MEQEKITPLEAERWTALQNYKANPTEANRLEYERLDRLSHEHAVKVFQEIMGPKWKIE